MTRFALCSLVVATLMGAAGCGTATDCVTSDCADAFHLQVVAAVGELDATTYRVEFAFEDDTLAMVCQPGDVAAWSCAEEREPGVEGPLWFYASSNESTQRLQITVAGGFGDRAEDVEARISIWKDEELVHDEDYVVLEASPENASSCGGGGDCRGAEAEIEI